MILRFQTDARPKWRSEFRGSCARSNGRISTLRINIGPMRPASILLALIVVLGFVSEARATTIEFPTHDYTVRVGQQVFGFIEWSSHGTEMYFGPLGHCGVPFTATQGLVGVCLIVVGLIALLVTAVTFRWKRKAANRL